MKRTIGPLSKSDTFTFSCSAERVCFNDCCRDLNQLLTPYDILRLKQRLNLPANLFLKRYTSTRLGPETGLPVISLTAGPAPERRCPFVNPQGCRAYEDRPSSCRMYPLARIVSRCRESGRLREHYILLQETHCMGLTRAPVQTVGEWLEGQALSVYNEMNDLMMNIIALKDLQDNLATFDKSIFKIPLVIQYNKQDLADEGIPILPVETLENDLNKKLKVPSIAASAITGENVVETMKKAISLTVASLEKRLEIGG